MSAQLALPLKLQDLAVFESFWASGNDALVAYLMNLADADAGPGCWLYGSEATGKSHLLQAVCDRLGDDSVFVPMERFAASDPSVLDGLASRRCICLDNIDAVVADDRFELALFDLWNQVADVSGIVIVSARAAPRDSGFILADLLSRLTTLPAFRIEPLAESERINALQLRAGHRGLHLPSDTAQFLLRRSRRDMASLYGLLDRLDAEALKAQRRLTIPFVRDVLTKISSRKNDLIP